MQGFFKHILIILFNGITTKILQCIGYALEWKNTQIFTSISAAISIATTLKSHDTARNFYILYTIVCTQLCKMQQSVTLNALEVPQGSLLFQIVCKVLAL